jgi:SPP1 gp7 family putative phage head morphogenesis protein
MDPLLTALVQAGLLAQDAADALARMLDPTAQRMYAEGLLRNAVFNALQEQQQRILMLLASSQGDVSPAQFDAFWTAERGALLGVVLPALTAAAAESLAAAVLQGGDVSNWQEVHTQVVDWVRRYYLDPNARAFGSIPNLDAVSRGQLGEQFIAWQTGALRQRGYQEGLPDLIRAIEPIFGIGRAERIAATETTRIYAQVTQQMADANDAVGYLRWFTAADERVCPICGPLHGATRPKNQPFYLHPTLGRIQLPAHVNCRCWEGLETTATLAVPFESQWRYR